MRMPSTKRPLSVLVCIASVVSAICITALVQYEIDRRSLVDGSDAALHVRTLGSSDGGVTGSPKAVLEPPQLRDFLAAEFVRDPPDPLWIAQEREGAYAKVGAVIPDGSELRAIECRRSICRVETHHPDRHRYSQFLPDPLKSWTEFVAEGATASTTMDSPPGDSGLTMVSYIARHGALPNPS
jgi:hypothetical protein